MMDLVLLFTCDTLELFRAKDSLGTILLYTTTLHMIISYQQLLFAVIVT